MIDGFIQARNYTDLHGASRTVKWLVTHDMEHPEVPGAAHSVCQWFAGSTAPQASAHYNIDDAEIWQSVRDNDVAWHAPGANRYGLGFELTGYARQSPGDWSDRYSEAMLHRAAALFAQKARERSIPIRFCDAAALVRGEPGITTHWEVSKAFHATSHTDPGVNFPMAHFLDLIRGAAGGPLPAPTPPVTVIDYPGDNVKATKTQVNFDNDGHGWVAVQGVDPDAVIAGVIHGGTPAASGRYDSVYMTTIGRGTDGAAVCSFVGGPKGVSGVDVTIWTA